MRKRIVVKMRLGGKTVRVKLKPEEYRLVMEAGIRALAKRYLKRNKKA
jgi:hypothetical protein